MQSIPDSRPVLRALCVPPEPSGNTQLITFVKTEFAHKDEAESLKAQGEEGGDQRSERECEEAKYNPSTSNAQKQK